MDNNLNTVVICRDRTVYIAQNHPRAFGFTDPNDHWDGEALIFKHIDNNTYRVPLRDLVTTLPIEWPFTGPPLDPDVPIVQLPHRVAA